MLRAYSDEGGGAWGLHFLFVQVVFGMKELLPPKGQNRVGKAKSKMQTQCAEVSLQGFPGAMGCTSGPGLLRSLFCFDHIFTFCFFSVFQEAGFMALATFFCLRGGRMGGDGGRWGAMGAIYMLHFVKILSMLE